MALQRISTQFKALGTDVSGLFYFEGAVPANFLHNLHDRIEAFEARFSRFRPDSELSQLNAGAGTPMSVSDDMHELLKTSERVREETDGRVDVLLGASLLAAGYTVSFDTLAKDPTFGNSSQPHAFATATRSNVLVNTKKHIVTLPKTAVLDFGGVGKGYLLDKLHAWIAHFSQNFWLSLGGDLIIEGGDVDKKGWTIDIQNPHALDKNIAYITLPPGTYGIATSGITKRCGVHNGIAWHHLIDPKTGKPARTDASSATVIAKTALQADVFAKIPILEGTRAGIDWIQKHGAQAVVVTHDRHLVMTPFMETYLQRV